MATEQLTREDIVEMIKSTVHEALTSNIKNEASKFEESQESQQLIKVARELMVSSAYRDMMKARRYGARAVARVARRSIDAIDDFV